MTWRKRWEVAGYCRHKELNPVSVVLLSMINSCWSDFSTLSSCPFPRLIESVVMVLVWWRKRREVAAAFPAPCGGCCYGARRLQSTSSARPPRHSQCVPRVTAVEGRGPQTAAPLHHKTERLTAGVSVIFRPHQRNTWRGACEGSCQLWRWGPKTQK